MRPWKFYLLPLLLLSSLCFAAQPDRIPATIDNSQMVALAKSLHPQAQPQFDQGPVEDSLAFTYVTLIMAPSPSQQAALEQLLAQQQDRSSRNFRKWLTPAQYADRFGLSPNDISKLTAWLTAQGFQIISVGGGRNSIVISGTAAQIQKAFSTELHRYTINGKKHVANSVPLSVPAALAGVITEVRGIADFRPQPMYVRTIPKARKSRPHPDSKVHSEYTTSVDGETEYFLAPPDVALLYDLNPLYTASTNGAGQKLAIVGQTDVYLADLVDFRSGFSLNAITGCTTNSSGLITSCDSTYFQYQVVGTDTGIDYGCGDVTESDIDIEWSGATAQQAQIIFVNSPVVYDSNCDPISGGGVTAALDAVINPPSGPAIAPVVSMSYGSCELGNDSLETELQQGAAEGVTILNSSGDAGSTTCDRNPPDNEEEPPFSPAIYGLSVSYPASSPWVTGVGGTSIPLNDFSSTYWAAGNTNNESALSTLIGQEITWNDDLAFASICVGSNPTRGTFCYPDPGVEITSAQTVQEDYWISAGGGGVSNCFNYEGSVCESGLAQPTWQQGIDLGLSSPQSTYRMLPDVSLIASPNYPGYIICTPLEYLAASNNSYATDTASSCANGIAQSAEGIFSGENPLVYPSVYGGTSVSSPVFAGMVSMLNQYLGVSGLGSINSMLYSLAASNPTAFHHVTGGNNDVYCDEGDPVDNPTDVICPSTGSTPGVVGFSASNSDSATGYNLAAGLGSVDANVLFSAWSNSATAPNFTFQTTAALTPASVPAGQSATATLTITPVNGSTQTINFTSSSCSGQPTGATCSFSPNSVTLDGTDAATVAVTVSTLANMALPSGAQTITVTAAASTGNTKQTTTISLTVAATNQTVTINPGSATYEVAVGGTASVVLAVTGTNGFITGTGSGAQTALPITYTCSGLPSETTCNPASNPLVSSSTSPTISIVTQGATAQLKPAHGNRLFYALLLPGLFGVVLLAGSRSRAARMLSLIIVLGVSTMWLGSCGSSGGNSQSNPGTPTGSYTVTINATTGGSLPLTTSTTITLTVNAQ